MFAEIILANPARDFDKPYHYLIPEDLPIQIGTQVLIPFGKRLEVGYVVGLVEKADVEKVKPIAKVLSAERFFDEETLARARFISMHYGAFLIKALHLFMPAGMKGEEKAERKRGGVEKIHGRRSDAQSPKLVRGGGQSITIGRHFKPTTYQQAALDLIFECLEKQKSQTILLCGVTGSGKTEVYLQAVAKVLEKGQAAIVLVPEIILTPQLIERFTERFTDHLSILHSDKTVAERQREWQRIKAGQVRVVLGTRTALFSPLKNLGIIILDEEFENTYKSDQSPRYHARTVAEFICRQKNIPLVLGSATPAVESFFNAERGRYQKITLPERIDQRPLPPVTLVDMRAELKRGNRSILSLPLRRAMAAALERKEQVILYLNRLGYFSFVMCRDCGKTVECPQCSVSLSYYKKEEKLVCNRCGKKVSAPVVCPNCQSSAIKFFGSGIQRVEAAVADAFPRARILCLDRQLTDKRGAHAAIYGAFKEGKADVLIGTQLVTKGLDVAQVTVVGAVAADTSLNLPDFRAGERTFQQLTQVAGRAGRHHLPGKVIIQTYLPDHYAIAAAAQHDYPKFYAEEIKMREEAQFPPFVDLIRLIFTAVKESVAAAAAEKIVQALAGKLPKDCEILGPALSPIAKVRGKYRYHIVIKTKDLEACTQALHRQLETIKLPRDVNLAIDVDPQNML
ncbi:MAG: primosomal protein N' [Candidatus Margulisiibacteriota bacterium]